MDCHSEIERKIQDYLSLLPEVKEEWPFEIKQSIGFIHNNLFDKALNVSYIRQCCNITNNNFSGRFKYYLGKTPKDYILSHRISCAKSIIHLSNDRDVNIYSISYRLGFVTQSAFTSAFKTRTGKTPLNWQKDKIKKKLK